MTPAGGAIVSSRMKTPSWLAVLLLAPPATFALSRAQPDGFASSAVLAQLPDGPLKRQFIIDCTNCHQFGAAQAYPGGRGRTRAEWTAIIARMEGMAGHATGFPIMSGRMDADSLADWLATYLATPPAAPAPLDARSIQGVALVREFMIPVAGDLPHDIAVDSGGDVIVTGMFTGGMYVLDTASGTFGTVPIPVPNANPRAVEVAANGDWWVLLGGPHRLARYVPGRMQWSTYDVGVYAHSVALGADGRAWFNGHFTRDPERIGYVDMATGVTHTFDAPAHPTLARAATGGPIPYELRAARDGTLWMSELQGHRMLAFDPRTSRWRTYDMPGGIAAPRRFDVDSAGAPWIPLYAGNALVRLDPATGTTTDFPLPRKDAVPYIARVDGGRVWVATNASDEVYALDVASGRWTTYALPTRGAVIRHLVINPRNGDVWLAYGASPGIAARIARLRPTR
jgi:streptogramin lyase